ncbi:MAG: invasion associated locus B family protein [Bauldia sp.]|nr:invasion associated locus B family protein [Bauldia sp.]
MSLRKFARSFAGSSAAKRKVAFGVVAASLFAIAAVQAQTPAPPAAAPSDSPWTKVCDVNPQTNQPLCMVRSEVRNDTGMLIVQVTLTKVDNADRYRLVAFLPLGVRLPPGMGIRIDNVNATTAPFSICIPNPAVCVAEIEVPTTFIDQLKRGGEVAFVATNPQGTEMPIRVSLAGFTRVFDGQGINAAQAQTQMEELNAALQRSAEAARQRLIDQQNTVAPAPAPAAP